MLNLLDHGGRESVALKLRLVTKEICFRVGQLSLIYFLLPDQWEDGFDTCPQKIVFTLEVDIIKK